MTTIIYIFALIGAVTVSRWIHERWRTRRDKGFAWFASARR